MNAAETLKSRRPAHERRGPNFYYTTGGTNLSIEKYDKFTQIFAPEFVETHYCNLSLSVVYYNCSKGRDKGVGPLGKAAGAVVDSYRLE